MAGLGLEFWFLDAPFHAFPMFPKLRVLCAGPDSPVWRPQSCTLGLSPEWGWNSCYVLGPFVLSGLKPQPERSYVAPLWTRSGTVPGWCLMITMVGCGFRMSCNDLSACDNTAQMYHASGLYRTPFYRLLGSSPCPVMGLGQGLAILYLGLLLSGAGD